MTDMTSLRIKLSDGSSWPRPALETDEHYGVGHTLRYASDVTRQDLMAAAAICDAYGILVAESTQRQRDFVCREIRAALKSEGDAT